MSWKDVGSQFIANEWRSGNHQIEQCFVFQIVKLRNLTQSSMQQDQRGPYTRVLRITLTDGHSSLHAVELSPVKRLGLEKTAPGTKLVLNRVVIENGIILLDDHVVDQVIGGVERLKQSWQMKVVRRC